MAGRIQPHREMTEADDIRQERTAGWPVPAPSRSELSHDCGAAPDGDPRPPSDHAARCASGVVSRVRGGMTDVTSHPRQRAGRGAAPAPYRLVRPAARPVVVPALDPAQQEVVDHPGGPLLVLAGPGTGKTTTLVEAVVARIEAGADPEQVLVLTFGRRAAAELRDRITARLGRATKEPLARTFHSYAFGVLRREAALRGETAAAAAVRPGAGPRGPRPAGRRPRGRGRRLAAAAARRRSRTRGFAQELRDLMMRAYERGVTAEPSSTGSAGGRAATTGGRPRVFMRQYAGVTALREAAAYDPAELIRAVVGLWLRRARAARRPSGRRVRTSSSTSCRTPTPPRSSCSGCWPATGATWSRSATPTSRSTASAAPTSPASGAFRDTLPHAAPATPAPVVCARHLAARSGTALLAATRRVARALGGQRRPPRPASPVPGLPPGEVVGGRAALRGAGGGARRGPAARTPTSSTACPGRDGGAGPLHRARRCRCCAGRWPPPACRSRCRGDEVPLAAGARGAAAAAAAPLRRPDRRPSTRTPRSSCSPPPLGGADVMALRRLRQALRRAELDAGGGRAVRRRCSSRRSRTPPSCVTLDRSATRPAHAVAELLSAAARGGRRRRAPPPRTSCGSCGSAPGWPPGGSGPAARAAQRARRPIATSTPSWRCSRPPPGSATGCPAPARGASSTTSQGQEIPGDEPSVRPVADDAVQVLTAHASKGLEWDLVCVAGVQEGVWPDLADARLVPRLRTAGRPAASRRRGGRPPRSRRPPP